MTQPLSIPVEQPRVTFLRLTCAWGRTAAAVTFLLLVGLAAYGIGTGLVWPLVGLLLMLSVLVPFAIVLMTEICQLLHDMLVPR